MTCFRRSSRPKAAILADDPHAMQEKVLDHQAACAVQAEAQRMWCVVGWKVVWDPPEHPGKFVACLLSGCPSAGALVDDTLDGLRAQLPPDLRCHPYKPADAVELWFVL